MRSGDHKSCDSSNIRLELEKSCALKPGNIKEERGRRNVDSISCGEDRISMRFWTGKHLGEL